MLTFRKKLFMCLLSASATLLPIFLFSELSLFTQLASIYIAAFCLHSLFINRNLKKESPIKNIATGYIITFITTCLILQHPALLPIHYSLTCISILFNHADIKFFRSIVPSRFRSFPATTAIIVKTLQLTMHLAITAIISPYMPTTALEIIRNNIVPCILIGKITEKSAKPVKLGAEKARKRLSDSFYGKDSNNSSSPGRIHLKI